MDRTAYVVWSKFGDLGIYRVTVERETDKSYILATASEDHGIVGWGCVAEYAPVFTTSAYSPYIGRVFAKDDLIFFTPTEALEECAQIMDKRIASARLSLSGLEKQREEVRCAAKAQGADDDRDADRDASGEP